jgi:tRNA (adenine22-N1)-methyltransferase
MLADMVTPGSRLVDVGCDHGFLSIYLVQEGACPAALAMDVREGPLAAARRHVEAYRLGDYITLRLSDGLAAYRAGEAEALVCAGMGGRLMERILREGMDLARGMRELILQPQSELPQFRAFLREAGFGIVQEDAIREDGKYYFAMKARPGAGDSGQMPVGCGGEDAGTSELYDLFGEHLLKSRHPVLFAYLRQRRSYLGRLGADLEAAGSARAGGRLEEVRRELAQIEEAFCRYG